MYEIVCRHVFLMGKGSVRYMNGSNVIETLGDPHQTLLLIPAVQCGTYLLAFGTNQRALVLALEKVDNNAVVPFHVSIPGNICKFDKLLIAPTFPVRLLYVRLLQHSIQVFV